MIETSSTFEQSEELKNLALRFFAFDDEFWVKRTEKFMELSSALKDLRNDVDEMLRIMQTGKPFKQLESKNPKYGLSGYGSITDLATQRIIEYSMESIFKEVLSQAERFSAWGKQSHRRIPHAEALAWIAYFAEWDAKEEKLVPSQNWIDYYNECYPATNLK